MSAPWRLGSSGQQRAGAQAERVQQGLVEQPHVLGHVQADELRIEKHGGVVWIAMALAVASRLWLGAVVQVSRDGALAERRARLVRRCVVPGPLVWSVDGWAPSVRAILRIFRDPLPPASAAARRCAAGRAWRGRKSSSTPPSAATSWASPATWSTGRRSRWPPASVTG